MPRGVARIPEPWEWVRTKKCPQCGETKPWALYSPVRYWEDGSVRRIHSWCRKCKTAANRRWAGKPVAPERLEYLRNWKRARRRALRLQQTNHVDMLPLEPFRSWLDARIDELGIGEVAEIANVQPRSLFRVMSDESKNVSLSLVDRVLVAFGEHVDNFYPLENAA